MVAWGNVLTVIFIKNSDDLMMAGIWEKVKANADIDSE
jgi:hypothetical protein